MEIREWVDEDKDYIVGEIVDGMIRDMTLEEMRKAIWDLLYNELIFNEWPDLWMHAEQYAPDVLEQFQQLHVED